jgi:hypothetical protein
MVVLLPLFGHEQTFARGFQLIQQRHPVSLLLPRLDIAEP